MRLGLMITGTAAIFFAPAYPASAQGFGGPYVGVHAAGPETGVRNPDTAPGPGADRRSFTGGLFTGYDRQVTPHIVLGAEAGIGLAAGDAARARAAAGLVALDPGWSLDLAGRAGYLLDPTTLFYVRGGYSNARIDAGATAPASRLSESEYRDAWTLGAGIERRILKRISARLEYRYADPGEIDGAFDRHRLLGGIAYRF